MKYIWVTFDGIGLCIANRLIQEGCDVTVAQIQDNSELGYKVEPEHPETKRRRLSLYDGILKKQDAKKVLKAMAKVKNKDDYFVVFDFNNLYRYAEMAVKMGYKHGIFPTKELYEFEKDREKAKEFVKENYPSLTIPEVKEFSDVKTAVDFLQESEEKWVAKGNNDNAKTVVPDCDDLEQWKEQLIDALESHKKDYESDGFILEKFVSHGFEFTPEMWWNNGVPIASSIDIENKPLGSRNESVQTGCSQNMVIATNLESKANKIAFPEAIHEKAKKHVGLFIWDAGIMFNPEDNNLYFTEFCACRMGWDAIMTEIAMNGSANDFFMALDKGENPFNAQFGAAVRGFNMHKESDEKGRRVLEGLPIQVGVPDNTWVYEMKMGKDGLENTGNSWDLAVFTGASDNPNEAVEIAYEARYAFGFENMYARPLEDFISMQYHSAIPIRYQFINHSLLEGPDFSEISAFHDDIEKAYNAKIELVKKDLAEEHEKKEKEMGDSHSKEIESLKEEIRNILSA